MEYNIKKCSVIELGKSNNRISRNYNMGFFNIDKKMKEKDLGITIKYKTSPQKHICIYINKITAVTYNLLRNITATFAFIDENMMRKLIVTIIQPR